MSACIKCGPMGQDAMHAKRAGVALAPGQAWRTNYWSDGKGQAVRCARCDGTGELDDLEEESKQREHDEWIELGRDE